MNILHAQPFRGQQQRGGARQIAPVRQPIPTAPCAASSRKRKLNLVCIIHMANMRGGGMRGGRGGGVARGGARGGRGGGGQGGGRRNTKQPEAIVFDTDARAKFLTTFQKRKQERRSKAKQELEEMQREAKRQVRKKRRDDQEESIRQWQEERGMELPDLLAIGADADAGEGEGPQEEQYDEGEQVTTVTTITELNFDDDDSAAGGESGDEDAADDDDPAFKKVSAAKQKAAAPRVEFEDDGDQQRADAGNIDYEARALKLQRKLATLTKPKRLKSARPRGHGGDAKSKRGGRKGDGDRGGKRGGGRGGGRGGRK